jgi:transposase InsO family protein
LESSIFSCFDLPLEIIYDSGPAFISAKLTHFFNKFGVKHFTSSSYYPQGNGKVESTNKNMINILNEKPRPWHTLLIYALWEDRTTTKINIGHTHFQILYDQEDVMPV